VECYIAPSINFKNSDIALYIRKDPVFLNRFSFENTYFIGTKENESRIKYNYSRVPTVWIKNPPSNNQSIMTIELMDGQILSLSRDGVYQFLSIDENQITFCGQISDPIYHPEFLTFLEMMDGLGNGLRVATNGTNTKGMDEKWWEKAYSYGLGENCW